MQTTIVVTLITLISVLAGAPSQTLEIPDQGSQRTIASRASDDCAAIAAPLSGYSADPPLAALAQERAVIGRLLQPSRTPSPEPPALGVSPRPQNGVSFSSRASGSNFQVIGTTERTGELLSFEFDHETMCSSTSVGQLYSSGKEAQITIRRPNEPSLRFRIEAPWAVDARGRQLHTWYESDGLTLRQIIDAKSAVAPIIFDPTYSAITCEGYWSNLNAYEFLNMYNNPIDDVGTCPVKGMFTASRSYIPTWGLEANVANDYGKVMVKEFGECSAPARDTGFAWDFRVPCRAHDFCYDLRRAGFSGTVTDFDCDDAFRLLMEAHCNDRPFADDCRYVRDVYHAGVRLFFVTASSDPEPVQIMNRATGKCADVEASSLTDGTPIQQLGCLAVASQRYRIAPAPLAPGAFWILPAHSNSCLKAVGLRVVQEVCDENDTSQRFEIQGALNQDQYVLRSESSSFKDCVHVPNNSFADGTDLDEPLCNDTSTWYIWRINDV